MDTGDGWPSARLDEHWNVDKMDLRDLAGLSWEPRRFVAGDAYLWDGRGSSLHSRPPEDPAVGFRVVAGGWDHEHCSICTASTRADGEWVSGDHGHWLCVRCHGALVEWAASARGG